MKPETLFPIFFAIWTVLAVSTWIFFAKGSLEAKQRWYRPIGVGAGVLFLGFIAALFPPFVLTVAVPAVVLITFLNFKMIKFCQACGATLTQHPPWSSIKYCPKCGAKLRRKGT